MSEDCTDEQREIPRPHVELPEDPSVSMKPVLESVEGSQDFLLSSALPFVSVIEDSNAALQREQTADAQLPAYVLKHVVGRGGFGEVWEAFQSSLRRRVAVKRPKSLSSDRADSDLAQHVSFQKEALLTARLDHPNIVPVHDLGIDENGRPLLAMKLVEGTAWHQQINYDLEHLPYSLYMHKHLQIYTSVCQAVAFAHSRGVIHRDLKPAQVMIGRYGEVYLMDWGLAVGLTLNQADSSMATVTFALTPAQAPSPAGTIAFMAPEQTDQDGARLGAWTDIYLLGGVLYNILTGTPPRVTTNPMEAFVQATHGEVEPPEKRAPQFPVPPPLSKLCMHAMQPKITDRVSTVGAIIESVKDFLSGVACIDRSQELTKQAEQSLPQENASYEQLEACDRLLSEALSLWPENDRASALRHQELVLFVKTALGNRDLGLAKVQASRIQDEPTRAQLLRDIEHRSHLEHVYSVQRRLAIAACIILAVGVSCMAAIGYYGMQERQHTAHITELKKEKKALHDRALAEEAEANAHREEADLQERATTLVAREDQVASALRAAFPLPTTLDTTAVLDQLSPPQKTLLTHREELRRERDALIARGMRPPVLPDLMLADATVLLATDVGTTASRAAHALLEKMLPMQSHLDAAPLVAMAVAAARAGHDTSASNYLRNATYAVHNGYLDNVPTADAIQKMKVATSD